MTNHNYKVDSQLKGVYNISLDLNHELKFLIDIYQSHRDTKVTNLNLILPPLQNGIILRHQQFLLVIIFGQSQLLGQFYNIGLSNLFTYCSTDHYCKRSINLGVGRDHYCKIDMLDSLDQQETIKRLDCLKKMFHI